MVYTRQKAGKWEARTRIGGKEISRLGSSEDEAKARLKAALWAMLPTSTFDGYRRRYLNSLKLHRSPKYFEQAEYALSKFDCFLGREIANISKADVQAVFDRIAESKLSPSTIHTFRKHIQALFQLAEDEDSIKRNPVRRIMLPAIRRVPKDVLSPLEVMKLINASRGYSPHPFIVLGCLLGCDPGEVGSLDKNWMMFEGCIVIPGTKNDNRNRVVPAPEAVLKELEGYTPPFPYSKGSVRRDVLSAAFRAQIRQDDRPLYPKLLRHTFATGMQSIGADLEVRARIMGHARKSITEGYSHADALLYRPWVEKWCSKVYGSMGNSVGKADNKGGKIDEK